MSTLASKGDYAQVGSLVTFCQFNTVGTIQHAAVLEQILSANAKQGRCERPGFVTYITPRLMRAHKLTLTRNETWTFHNMMMGKAARKKSEIIDITGVELVVA